MSDETTKETDLLRVDGRFDQALVAADLQALDQILADDFVLIDLIGNQVPKLALLAAIESRQLLSPGAAVSPTCTYSNKVNGEWLPRSAPSILFPISPPEGLNSRRVIAFAHPHKQVFAPVHLDIHGVI